MAAEMMRLTLAIAGKTLFSADVENDATGVGQALADVMHAFMRLNSPFAPILDRLPLPSTRRALEGIQRLDGIIYRMISEHRSSGGRDDLLTILLATRDEEGDQTGMDDRQLRDEVMTIFLAGHETTAVALTWTWYLLAQHPEVAEKLHQELAHVLNGRPPGFSDVPALVYTRRIFSEALRLYPPVYVTGRKAMVEFQAGDFLLPAGSNIMISPWITHRDPRWWAEPQQFDPDRWIGDNEGNRPKFAYFPFGGGPRICIGESFAWTEGILVLASLAQCWAPEVRPGFRAEIEPLITLRPKKGMPMVLKAR